MNMKRIIPKSKKAQLGLDTVKQVMVAFLIIAVLGVAIILALVSLRDSNIFPAGSAEQNDTNDIVTNISGALTDFFSNTGTIFAILVVVVIILAIAIIIAVVSRFSTGTRGGV